MSNKVRNPSPDELNKLKNSFDINSEKQIPSKTILNDKVVDIEDLKIEPIKEESFFSPEKVYHKLILPKEYYKNIKHINDNSEILVRRMTAVEEGFFYDMFKKENTGDLLVFFEVINKVLEQCVRSNIDYYELNIIEKVPLFMFVLALTYGSIHEFIFKCNECNKEYKVNLDIIEDLETFYPDENDNIPYKIKLTSYLPYEIFLYISTPRMKFEKEYLKEDSSWFEKLSLINHGIEGVIKEKEITEEDYDEILKNLNTEDTKNIKEINNKFTKEFGINLSDINIKLCSNNECSLYNKVQQLSLPIDYIFIKMFKG